MAIPSHISEIEKFRSRLLGWYNGVSIVLLSFFIASDLYFSGSLTTQAYSIERNLFLFVMLVLSSAFLRYRMQKTAGLVTAIACLLAIEVGIWLESVRSSDASLGLVICGLGPVLLSFTGLFLTPKVNILFSIVAATSLGIVSYFQPWSPLVHAYVYVLTVFGTLGAGIVSSLMFQKSIAELSKLHQQKNQLLNVVPVTISVISREGEYLEVNRTLSKLFGVEPEYIIGKKVGFLSGEYSQVFSAKFKEFVASDDRDCDFDLTFKMENDHHVKDFAEKSKSITVKLLKDPESKNIIAVGVDRTILQRLELTRADDEKWIGLGQMAGGIGHEINNPLTIIMGTVEQLQEKMDAKQISDPAVQRAYKVLIRQVHRISNIVRSLKRFSRKSKDDPLLSFGLKEIIDESIELCRQGLKMSGTKIGVEQSPLLSSKVLCRPSDLMQVFVNLISNANDALVELNLNDKWIRIIIVNDHDGFLVVRFIDAGKGISDSLQKKMFDPFFTTKDIGKGTGLGLSLSRRILEEHSGQLYYETYEGNTSFNVRMPKV